MSQNPRGLTPLNWQSYVDEALRRRKQEHLTQREHAALANVSLPTIAAFERAETTLSLAKAFDILRVLGLLDEPKPEDAHDRFVRDAFKRWQSLAETLPADSPGRFPHGWFRFDYQLVGELRRVGLEEFRDVLLEAELSHTSWPLYMTSTRSDQSPEVMDGDVESWLHQEDNHPLKRSINPSYSDFWRASPSGSFFLIRGYQEDGQETFPPGSILDATIPALRLAEALLHAERLSALLSADSNTSIVVHFRAVYSGLAGRVLRSWSNPLNELYIEGNPATSSEAVLQISLPAKLIKEKLVDHVGLLTSELYSYFGVGNRSRNRIAIETEKLITKLLHMQS